MDKDKKAPVSDRLPGMQEPAIEELEQLAKLYAKARDKRQAILVQEVNLKGQILAAMKKEKKTEYVHGKISIKIVAENEKVKVKITEDDDE